jgi:hypothetical protein
MIDSNVIHLVISLLDVTNEHYTCSEGLIVLANLAVNIDNGHMIMKDSRAISIPSPNPNLSC